MGRSLSSHLVEVMPQSEAHYDLTAHDCARPGVCRSHRSDVRREDKSVRDELIFRRKNGKKRSGQKLTDEGQGESRRQPRAGIPQEVDEAVQNLRPDEEIRVVYELEQPGAEEVRPEGPAEGADQRGVPPAASAAFGPAVPPLPGGLPASVPGELPRPLRQEPPVRRLRAAVGREGVGREVLHVEPPGPVAGLEERADPAEGQRRPRPGREGGRGRGGGRGRVLGEEGPPFRVFRAAVDGGGRPGLPVPVGDPDGSVVVGPAAHIFLPEVRRVSGFPCSACPVPLYTLDADSATVGFFLRPPVK